MAHGYWNSFERWKPFHREWPDNFRLAFAETSAVPPIAVEVFGWIKAKTFEPWVRLGENGTAGSKTTGWNSWYFGFCECPRIKCIANEPLVKLRRGTPSPLECVTHLPPLTSVLNRGRGRVIAVERKTPINHRPTGQHAKPPNRKLADVPGIVFSPRPPLNSASGVTFNVAGDNHSSGASLMPANTGDARELRGISARSPVDRSKSITWHFVNLSYREPVFSGNIPSRLFPRVPF